MKTFQIIFCIIDIIICFIGISLSLNYGLGNDYKQWKINQHKIHLPEEYKSITKSDTLKGYFDKDSILHIEFNNYNNH